MFSLNDLVLSYLNITNEKEEENDKHTKLNNVEIINNQSVTNNEYINKDGKISDEYIYINCFYYSFYIHKDELSKYEINKKILYKINNKKETITTNKYKKKINWLINNTFINNSFIKLKTLHEELNTINFY
jgi:hypothetical protein